ncbi:MAG: 2-oxoglutarate dehydrogenase E1 component, partial [Pseudomonadota bacterium]
MPHDGSQGDSFSPRSAIAASSFLSGGNAKYLLHEYRKYAQNPNSVDAELSDFFAELGDDDLAELNASGPSWQRADWPPTPSDETISALNGDWSALDDVFTDKVAARSPSLSPTDVTSAVRDSIKALMLIRAYRIRGHMIADLDPLKMRAEEVHPELDPAHYGFEESDWEREIFIDNVLGLETANMHTIVDLLKRTYCGTFGIEFLHITDPVQK